MFSTSAFSAASSSISVISVPFDVTGDGPTISLLGLIKWAELGLAKGLGRRDWESGPEEELLKQNKGQDLDKMDGSLGGIHTPCTGPTGRETLAPWRPTFLRARNISR